MKAADIERKNRDTRVIGLQVPIRYVTGSTLRQFLLETTGMPRTSDGEELVDDQMYAITPSWIYRVE